MHWLLPLSLPPSFEWFYCVSSSLRQLCCLRRVSPRCYKRQRDRENESCDRYVANQKYLLTKTNSVTQQRSDGRETKQREARKSAGCSGRKEKALNIIAWSVTDDWIHPFSFHITAHELALSLTHIHTTHTVVTSRCCQSDIGLPRIVSRPVNLPEPPLAFLSLYPCASLLLRTAHTATHIQSKQTVQHARARTHTSSEACKSCVRERIRKGMQGMYGKWRSRELKVE